MLFLRSLRSPQRPSCEAGGNIPPENAEQRHEVKSCILHLKIKFIRAAAALNHAEYVLPSVSPSCDTVPHEDSALYSRLPHSKSIIGGGNNDVSHFFFRPGSRSAAVPLRRAEHVKTEEDEGRSRRVQPIHCNVVCTSQVDDCTLKISEPPPPSLLRCTAHGICTLDRGESPARAEERASERLPDRLPRCSAAPTHAGVLPNSGCGEGSLQCLSLAVGCDLQVHHQRGPIVVHST